MLESSGDSTAVATEQPRLVLQSGSGDTFEAANVSDVGAFNVRAQNVAEPPIRGALRVEEGSAPRLSPGASWTAGLYAATMGKGNTPVIRLTWENRSGDVFNGDFPL